ncbi:hypothetical protein OGAPHI_003153 [Ogataea philodendri]|uniref:Amino acid transporter transmembrane domain-containing protein n=1 Tax=Ogataea philodendri TaxID=1378263 RepID=A0A9P8T6K4_9ASCO|nr:uncharacterized protein OGAPHI_003153 [Ogataea philodendri]KAH3667504.1 hypothetical protein OGAPHI_003153 [Ogataea philodendri]
MTSLEKTEKTVVEVNLETVSVSEFTPVGEPSIISRLFYAQRSMEKQYEEVRHQRGLHWWNDWMYKLLRINSLEPKSDDYPTWNNDSLSLRTSHWFVCAGILTSEIMGASLVPNSIALVGYVTGNIILIVCFFLTILAGGVTWWLFLLLDSPEYPIKSLADIAYVLGGKTWRHIVIFLQLIAMILTAANCGIGALESAVILQDKRYCWSGLLILFCGVACVVCHIRSLSNLGKFCLTVSVINYICLAVQLGFYGEPNWQNAKNLLGLDPAPVVASNFVTQTLVYKLVAISNISYVFAGSVVFPEILSEMRRPWDFWKTMLASQMAILGCYLIYGNYVYSQQGQFANSPAVFGIANVKAMKGLAFIGVFVGGIQAVLYGHISAKIAYKNYLDEIIKNLAFHSKKGQFLWSTSVVTVWIVIFVLATGVPNVPSISSFTSALTMIPLTYVIPYWFNIWGYFIKQNAEMIESFDPTTGVVVGYNKPMSKFMAAGFKNNVLLTLFYVCLSLASLAFAGMGLYGSVEYMKDIFANTPATSFSCTSPI